MTAPWGTLTDHEPPDGPKLPSNAPGRPDLSGYGEPSAPRPTGAGGGSGAGPRGDPRPPPGPTRVPVEIRDPGAITTRSAITVVVLSVLTCGFYFIYWLYVTTRELRDALGDPELKPGQDLVLLLLTCGIWSILVMYRNAQKVHAALLSKDPYARDQSETVVLLGVVTLFSGFAGFIAAYVLQQELNKLVLR